MIRPDKTPSGNSPGRHVLEMSLYQAEIQSYPDWHHYGIRFILLKYNTWYGSLFEIHFGERGNGYEVDYLDFLFLRCLVKKSKDLDFSKFLLPWQLADKLVAKVFLNPIWKSAMTWLDDNVFPKQGRINNEIRKHRHMADHGM